VPERETGEPAPLWAYLRKSRALGDSDDPTLLGTHRDLLARLIAADGHAPPREYWEEIGSAESIEARPVFCRLLASIEALPANSGGTLYVVDLLRLTRGSGADWARIDAALQRAGIRVRTRSRLFDPREPDDATWMEFEVFFGRMELRYMKARAALKRAQMVRDGQIRTGRVPFGYRWDLKKKQPTPHPDQFPLLQYACREILTTSVQRIAAHIGIPTDTLFRALHNPTICGWPAQRFMDRPPGREPNRHGWRLPRAEWIWPERPGDYPAACSRAEWDAIQAALASRNRERSKTDAGNGWCRDVLRFEGATGRVRLGTYNDHRRPGSNRPDMSHPTYDLIRPDGPPLTIARDLVHAAAVAALTAVFSRPQGLAIAAAVLQRQQEAERAPAASGRPLEALRADVARERQRWARLKESEFDPDPEAARAARTAQETVRARLRGLLAECETLEQRASAPPELQQAAPVLAALSEQFPTVWEILPDPSRRVVVRAMLAAIHVSVQPRRGSRPAVREVVAVELQEWVPRPA
jgi:DNA invertase Pin-like site-specific DNA recombinase